MRGATSTPMGAGLIKHARVLGVNIFSARWLGWCVVGQWPGLRFVVVVVTMRGISARNQCHQWRTDPKSSQPACLPTPSPPPPLAVFSSFPQPVSCCQGRGVQVEEEGKGHEEDAQAIVKRNGWRRAWLITRRHHHIPPPPLVFDLSSALRQPKLSPARPPLPGPPTLSPPAPCAGGVCAVCGAGGGVRRRCYGWATQIHTTTTTTPPPELRQPHRTTTNGEADNLASLRASPFHPSFLIVMCYVDPVNNRQKKCACSPGATS